MRRIGVINVGERESRSCVKRAEIGWCAAWIVPDTGDGVEDEAVTHEVDWRTDDRAHVRILTRSHRSGGERTGSGLTREEWLRVRTRDRSLDVITQRKIEQRKVAGIGDDISPLNGPKSCIHKRTGWRISIDRVRCLLQSDRRIGKG